LQKNWIHYHGIVISFWVERENRERGGGGGGGCNLKKEYVSMGVGEKLKETISSVRK
jgi:hypothetical protein